MLSFSSNFLFLFFSFCCTFTSFLVMYFLIFFFPFCSCSFLYASFFPKDIAKLCEKNVLKFFCFLQDDHFLLISLKTHLHILRLNVAFRGKICHHCSYSPLYCYEDEYYWQNHFYKIHAQMLNLISTEF